MQPVTPDVLFFHVPKTGGASVHEVVPQPFGHKTAEEILGIVGLWYFRRVVKFSIIRHPCDRLVSYYHWTLQMPSEHPWYASMTGARDFLKRYEDFQQLVLRVDGEVFYNELHHPLEHYLEIGGRVACDYLLRYEHLDEDWASFASHRGLPLILPRRNASEHPPWQECYTPLMLSRMRALCGASAAKFGYVI